MLRNKPVLKYSGITLVLSNPSRFDKMRLLTATGGVLMNDLLQPDCNLMQCDIRVADDDSPFIEGTKCIMLLGAYALHKYCPGTANNTLNELRGAPLMIKGIPAIASFFPQDAADVKNYENKLNEQSKTYEGDEANENKDEDEDDGGDVKSHSATKRANYAFWLKSDIDKCKKLIRNGLSVWPIEQEPIYKIYPPAEEVINVLRSTKDCFMYFDIETDYEEQNLLCFSFSFDGKTVYSVPVLNHEYRWAYSSLSFIIRALIVAIRNNILVAHNGAGFDFIVLGLKYHIPVRRVYDTMIAQHRCFPEVEKSLGHCVSLWTYQPFHKDTDSQAYRTHDHVMQKLRYCGKDVFTMFLVHKAIERYAKTIPGLVGSIDCAMRSLRPYLTITLQGIRYSEKKLKEVCDENDRLMMQYNRIIEMLIGPEGTAACKKAIKSGKPSMMPGSNAQCCSYFHDQLGYPVVVRSQKTGKPSLGKGAMFKLALKHDNPVIRFILMFRILKKEYSDLKFVPFKNDDGTVVDYKKYVEAQDA